MDLDSLVTEMRQRAGQNLQLGYKIKFLVDDDVVFWDGTEHPPKIDSGAAESNWEEPNTTITISSENLAKLMHGKLDPTLGYMTGKLKVEGSMGVALKLTSMFSD